MDCIHPLAVNRCGLETSNLYTIALVMDGLLLLVLGLREDPYRNLMTETFYPREFAKFPIFSSLVGYLEKTVFDLTILSEKTGVMLHGQDESHFVLQLFIQFCHRH